MELFVTCAQGIEPLLHAELTEMGFASLREGFRGIYVADVDLKAMYRINYCSRLGMRVLLPLARFRCLDQRSLYKGVSAVDWLELIPKHRTFAIDANVTHRNLRNSLFASQVAKDAICDQYRERTGVRPNVSPKNPDIQLNLFIREDKAVISIDTSGMPLHKRGYRQESGEAPMQETLAAALLKIAGYTGNEVLCDPCCGSGTILIEAALMASKTAPGYLRQKWGFMDLPDFTSQDWLRVKNEVDIQRQPLPGGLLFGCDISKDIVRICKANLRAAGFLAQVDIQQNDFRSYTPQKLPNLIIANPPHGIRMENYEPLKILYRSLGDFMKYKSAKPAKGFVFTGNLELAKEVGLKPTQRHELINSGVESRFLEFDLF
jgi:23S rRNA (guanine2445-N2)-methyltransferase